MVKLSSCGAFLLNGEEVIENNAEAAAILQSKTGSAVSTEEAKKNTKTPTLIEFIIDPEDLVYPMVKPGGTLEELIMDC